MSLSYPYLPKNICGGGPLLLDSVASQAKIQQSWHQCSSAQRMTCTCSQSAVITLKSRLSPNDPKPSCLFVNFGSTVHSPELWHQAMKSKLTLSEVCLHDTKSIAGLYPCAVYDGVVTVIKKRDTKYPLTTDSKLACLHQADRKISVEEGRLDSGQAKLVSSSLKVVHVCHHNIGSGRLYGVVCECEPGTWMVLPGRFGAQCWYALFIELTSLCGGVPDLVLQTPH